MQWILLVLLLAVVGAIVGAATNALAIRMLFRPHRAYYIGKWQLPLTPGLLPRRQQELATQMGNLVANHLLTAEGLSKKLTSEMFSKELTDWVSGRVKQWLTSDNTVESMLKPLLSIDNGKDQLVIKSRTWLKERLKQYVQKHQDTAAKQLVPQEIQSAIVSYLPGLSKTMVSKAKVYVESAEGQEKMAAMATNFLSSKGKFGGMVSMFLSSEKVVEMVYPEIVKFLDDEKTTEMLHGLLAREWEQLLEKPVSSFEAEKYIDTVIDKATVGLEKNIPLLNWYDAPLQTWTTPYINQIVDKWAPQLVRVTTGYIEVHLTSIMKSLRLNEVIEQQVASFSMANLEELIMKITKKELRLITLLGGVIGGTVGLIQALIVHFFY
ncbi:hypothetical protein JCM19047_2025 [Bacillus sp. JCM 19047]|uniref:DUF445 family protein n=1 Tax=Shouchella miscanthi TaxID=2598861 RepID=A0ABU6NQ85_9BACI|nr:DUF445 family protein [Shouchella miscanthi]MED4129563.1 DUF445 family protein [Shouchella miscanthi]GAF22284.1 hypothetical protein JCM19047_2025 [Bacillus sp. JCM 19047]